MNKKKIIAIISMVAVVSCLFAGCGSQGKLGAALRIPEQTTISVEDQAKIYPSQVGNVLTDAKVDVPSITAFMEKYNSAADDYTKINYDGIRYNAEQGYYYVNDTESSRGIKFKLDSSNNIISASVYSGNINDQQTSLVDMVSIAANTIGYKNVMSSSDKSQLNSIIGKYNATQGKVSSSASLFGDMDLTINHDNLFVAVDLPAMPESYNDEDVSSVNENANNTITNKKDENSSNPALNNGSGLDVGDGFQNEYQSDINNKLQNSITKGTESTTSTDTNK